MNEKKILLEMKTTIEELKMKKGFDSIKSENLIAYLNNVINLPDSETSDFQKDKYRAELQLWVERDKANQTSNMEMFKSVITLGQNALRSAFIMNGGASVALLAFLGKLSDAHQEQIPVFSRSLLIYVFGVLLIVVASGITYLSQWCYSTSKREQKGRCLHALAVISTIASYGFFIWGSIVAYNAFLKFV